MKNLLFGISTLLWMAPLYCQETPYVLIWSDEFQENGSIDTNNWHHQTQLPNGDSWYNNEIQHYTNNETNSFVSNGLLHIVAKKETFTDQGVTKQYTSARLNSKISFTYGKVEVRAKLPTGIGTWPAIWTLGQDIIEPGGYWSDDFGTTFWPACGELDIMEHWGNNQNFVQSAIHSPSSYGNTVNKGGQVIPNASTGFHVYTMEWTPEKIIFSVDGVEHYTYEPNVQNDETWPFDSNQYILLNFAILSSINPSFTEDALEIDYVRLYQDPSLGTIDISSSDISIYPNPVKDSLNINIPEQRIGAKLEIFSIINQKIMSQTLEETNSTINISNLKAGTYIVRLNNNGNIISKTFIKQ